MAFTQVITVTGADEQALHDHLAAWDSAQSGVAPGYLGARILADETNPGRHIIEVDFSSEEEARRNNDRADTKAWAEELQRLAGSRSSPTSGRSAPRTGSREAPLNDLEQPNSMVICERSDQIRL